MKYYIYIYLDPRKSGNYKYGEYEFDYEPFYIGKGKGRRYKEINGRNKYFKNKISKIKKYGLKPLVIKFKENLDEENSFILESKLISLIGREDLNKGTLVNFTDGGEGKSGHVVSEKTKELLSETNKGENNPMFGRTGENHPNYGNHPSEKTKELMSEIKKGENNSFYNKKHSEKTLKLMSKKKKGENNPKSILKEQDVIEMWKDLDEGNLTQREIAKKFGVNQQHISNIKCGKNWKHIKEKYK